MASLMTAQYKMVFAVSGLLSLELMHTCKNFPLLVGFVMYIMYCAGCLVCPLIVAVKIGMCHWTAIALCPDHPVKWLVLMTFIHVGLGNENMQCWQNLIKSCCNVMQVKLVVDSVYLDFLVVEKSIRLSIFGFLEEVF